MKTILIMCAVLFSFFSGNSKQNDRKAVDPPKSFYELSFKTIQGEDFSFEQLRRKKVLLVNTASKCGFTPQFAEVEALNQAYSPGLIILEFCQIPGG